MARTSSKRAALLVASLMLGAIAGSLPGAQAHGPDSAGWVEQAGDGKGASKPVLSNLEVGTVLYSANQFTVNHPFAGPAQRGFAKYMAWGTRPAGTGAQVFVVGSGADGISWGTPRAATIQDPQGTNVPFIIDQIGNPVVAATTYYDAPFIMFYRALGESSTTPAAIHYAQSANGIEWTLDVPLANGVGTPIVQAGGFKEKIIAPADLIFSASGTTSNATCDLATTAAYACRYTLLYTTEDAAGKRYTALARTGGQIGVPANTMSASGWATPALSPGLAGAWDDQAAENISVEQVGTAYRALYSGKKAGGTASLGWATSPDGVTWTTAATNPATPASLFGAATPSGGSLTKGQFISDASSEHQRVYISRTVGTSADMFLAATAPAPGIGPHVRISSPTSGAVIGPQVPITVYAGDTLGATPGLAMGTLSVTIDGIGGLGVTSDDTIVEQFKYAGKKIMALPTLADGAHTLLVSVKDLDGNQTSVSVNFNVDGQAPNTTITLAPAGPEIGFPDSIGKFGGTVTDAGGTGIKYVSAVVRNPLGQVKTYTTLAAFGWQVTKVSANQWNVIWVAPVLDPHFAVPGDYVVSLLGTDGGGLHEVGDIANTASVLVI